MKILSAMQLPIYSNKKVHFKDICIKLALDAIKKITQKDEFEKIDDDQKERLTREWFKKHTNIRKQDVIATDSGSYFAGQFIIRLTNTIKKRR